VTFFFYCIKCILKECGSLGTAVEKDKLGALGVRSTPNAPISFPSSREFPIIQKCTRPPAATVGPTKSHRLEAVFPCFRPDASALRQPGAQLLQWTRHRQRMAGFLQRPARALRRASCVWYIPAKQLQRGQQGGPR